MTIRVGFLLKDVDANKLHTAILTIAAGHSLLDPTNTRASSPNWAAPERLDDLSDREREAVRLAAEGLTNDQIAEQLIISRHTAKTHINRAMTKLAVRDRAQLVVIAYQTGLAAPPGTTSTRSPIFRDTTDSGHSRAGLRPLTAAQVPLKNRETLPDMAGAGLARRWTSMETPRARDRPSLAQRDRHGLVFLSRPVGPDRSRAIYGLGPLVVSCCKLLGEGLAHLSDS